MKDNSRRSFVKTSAATGLTFTFAGLIRAHGQSGGGNTTWNPEGTFFSTNSGETTTYDPNGTYVTTEPGVTTTWDPDQTTTTVTETSTVETTYLHYDISELAVAVLSAGIPPAPKAIVFSGQYGESDEHIVDIDYAALLLPVGSCDVRIRLKAWVDPNTSPHTAKARIIVRAEVYGLLYDHASNTPLSKSFIKGTEKRVLVGNCDASTGIITPSWGTEPEPSPDPAPYGSPSDSIEFGHGTRKHPLGVDDLVDLINIRVFCYMDPVLPPPSNMITVSGRMQVKVKVDGHDYHAVSFSPPVPPSVTPDVTLPYFTSYVGRLVGVNPEIPFALAMKSHLH